MQNSECVCVNPGEERAAGAGHCKGTGDCRQDDIAVKGNKNKLIIGSSFLHSHGQCKTGPVELCVGYFTSGIYLKPGIER